MTGGSFHSTEASGEVKTLMLKFYVSLQNMLERISRNEEGQTAVEYGLVVALISLIIVGALATGMGDVITNVVASIDRRPLGAAIGDAASPRRQVRPARRRPVSYGLTPARSSHSTCTFTTITSRLSNDSGQAAVEFALVLPLLIAFLFLIAGFARVFNAYNDLNQMAADGARFAAVGNFPGESALLRQRGHAAVQGRDDRRPHLPGARPSTWGPSCAVGGTVKVTATANLQADPVPAVHQQRHPRRSPQLQGTAEMRVERCPS